MFLKFTISTNGMISLR